MELVWNETEGHYELRDHDEFLVAVAVVDIPELIRLLRDAAREQAPKVKDEKLMLQLYSVSA